MTTKITTEQVADYIRGRGFVTVTEIQNKFNIKEYHARNIFHRIHNHRDYRSSVSKLDGVKALQIYSERELTHNQKLWRLAHFGVTI